jgi:hypothetical protein
MTTEPDTARLAEPDGPNSPSGIDLAGQSARGWIIGSAIVAVILVTWFFVSWLAMGRLAVDAAGESIGSGFALLLVVTLVGAVRRKPVSRRPPRR